MSQWGQNQSNRPNTGYGASAQWGAPARPPQQWAASGQWAPPRGQQGWAPPQGPPGWAPPQGGRPGWAPPQGQQGWAPPQGQPWTQNNAGRQVQQPVAPGYGYPPQGQPPKRKGGSQILKLLLFAIGGFVLVLTAFSLLSDADNPVVNPPSEYENENYQVPEVDQNPPELPFPETYTQATEWLTENPIYNVNIAVPVRCEAEPIDLSGASKTELQTHLNELTGCLMRVFGPAMEEAGYTAVRPSVTIYSSEVSTKCGTMPLQNAAYCAADQQVYYASDLPTIVPGDLQDVNYVVESVIAHEFAHAIQARTGILVSEAAWEERSDDATADNLSRRLETQADCWAGQFIESVGQSVGLNDDSAQELSDLFYSIGDDVLTGDPDYVGNHGSGKSRQTWFLTGHSSTSMGSCNTFIVGDDEIR